MVSLADVLGAYRDGKLTHSEMRDRLGEVAAPELDQSVGSASSVMSDSLAILSPAPPLRKVSMDESRYNRSLHRSELRISQLAEPRPARVPLAASPPEKPRRQPPVDNDAAYKRQTAWMSRVEEKRRELAEEKAAEEQMACSFAPRVNKRRLRQNQPTNVFDRLTAPVEKPVPEPVEEEDTASYRPSVSAAALRVPSRYMESKRPPPEPEPTSFAPQTNELPSHFVSARLYAAQPVHDRLFAASQRKKTVPKEEPVAQPAIKRDWAAFLERQERAAASVELARAAVEASEAPYEPKICARSRVLARSSEARPGTNETIERFVAKKRERERRANEVEVPKEPRLTRAASRARSRVHERPRPVQRPPSPEAVVPQPRSFTGNSYAYVQSKISTDGDYSRRIRASKNMAEARASAAMTSRERAELEKCTFAPQIRSEAPAYVQRVAEAMRAQKLADAAYKKKGAGHRVQFRN